METLNTVELDFPVIYDGETAVGYGGNQDWFPLEWARRAGCGSTSGANLAAFYASAYPQARGLYPGSVQRFLLPEYLAEMETLFQHMTPGPMGYPYAGHFVRDFIGFAQDRGVAFSSQGAGVVRCPQDGFGFVRDAIDSGNPVALLILHHCAPALKEDNWHWVTVTGYQEDPAGIAPSQVIFSNCGIRELWDADLIFQTCRANIIRMVRFRLIHERSVPYDL